MSTTLAQHSARSLRGIKLFECLSDPELKAVESQCRFRSYAKAETLLDRGGLTREVFFVLKGAAAAVTFSPAGREVTLGIIRSGDMFGELAAIDQEPRSATVTAMEATDVAIMSAEVFRDLLMKHAPMAFGVLQRLANIVRRTGIRIMELATLQAAQRVYAELLRMAKPDVAVPGLWVVRPLPPMHEIASLTGTTRETVNRAISQLYPTGLLKRKGRNLFIMERDKLMEIVQSLQVHHGRNNK
jgi:CRP/FNR family cyclic AMP-dependent transcriptional regulator